MIWIILTFWIVCGIYSYLVWRWTFKRDNEFWCRAARFIGFLIALLGPFSAVFATTHVIPPIFKWVGGWINWDKVNKYLFDDEVKW